VVHPSTGIGDDAWREVTAAYGHIVTDHLARFGGHHVKHVAYDGHVATLRDTKGVRDLARLLAAPRDELHVLDLGAEAGDTRLVETRLTTEAGDLHREHGSVDPVVDDRARVEYKHRIDELQADIDDADRRGDPEASVRARAELDAIVDELTAAYRPRRPTTPNSRPHRARPQDGHPKAGRSCPGCRAMAPRQASAGH
jgi:hypothetical protein